VHPLTDGREAFAARVLLAEAAERTLDVQCYIWRGDATGTLLFDALLRAADRGVRVRLLLDDNNTAGLDDRLAALDAHANLEVRLFNAFRRRGPRVLDYLFDFRRMNRRMHNKSLTADGAATIVGGRNVGDEYFAAGDGTAFVDLDVLAVGEAVGLVAADFERYWTSGGATRAATLLRADAAAGRARLRGDLARLRDDPRARAYARSVSTTPLVRALGDGTLRLEWAVARLYHDDPRKAFEPSRAVPPLAPRLAAMLGEPSRTLDVVSPYFVPGVDGTRALAAFARAGVQVRVLTNALEATDVAAVHAGYARRRRPLLAAGVRLFELRRDAVPPEWRRPARRGERRARRRRGRAAGGRRRGSSSSSLHAKTFAVDGRTLFVGSLNLDPRSARLNTELGLVLESPALAAWIADAFDRVVPTLAYEVRLANTGRSLRWTERRPAGDGDPRTHRTEPGAGLVRRLAVRALSHLPIEWLL
jgi:putative cardiolipin synthase